MWPELATAQVQTGQVGHAVQRCETLTQVRDRLRTALKIEGSEGGEGRQFRDASIADPFAIGQVQICEGADTC